jgi:hypothetical protein
MDITLHVCRRRQRELVDLLGRLRRLLRPYLAAQRVAVRQRCAARLLSFLEFGQHRCVIWKSGERGGLIELCQRIDGRVSSSSSFVEFGQHKNGMGGGRTTTRV